MRWIDMSEMGILGVGARSDGGVVRVGLAGAARVRRERSSLSFGLVLALGATTGLPCLAREPVADPFDGERLFADVVAYSDFGDHRTASAEDYRTAEWLETRMSEAGLETERQPFSTEQFMLDEVSVTVGGRAIEGYPLWIPAATSPEGVAGALRVIDEQPTKGSDLSGVIPLVRLQTARGGRSPVIDALAAAGARAILAVLPHPSGEIFGSNTYQSMPVTVVLVPPREETSLRKAAAEGAQASVRVAGRLDPAARAFEVVGRVEGKGPLLVVSTPYSAWTRAAGERGPGIAYFLALARWAASQESGPSWLFVASSGHELRGAGIRAFFEHAPSPESVGCWLHLGASIAGYDHVETPEGLKRADRRSPQTRLLTNSPELVPVLEQAFAGVDHPQPQLGTQARGELQLMFSEGYPTFGFEGAFAYFHTPLDLPELSTSPEILEETGRALLAAVQRITTLVVAGNRPTAQR